MHTLVSRVFAHGPGDRGSIPDQDIPKTQKMLLDAALPNPQRYKLRIKSKLEQFMGIELHPPLELDEVAFEK